MWFNTLFWLTTGGETFKSIEEDHTSTSAVEKQDSDMMALHTAERFIKELRPKTTTAKLRQQVLSSYILLASKKKPDAEQALQKFVDIASGEVSWSFSRANYKKFHYYRKISFLLYLVWPQLTWSWNKPLKHVTSWKEYQSYHGVQQYVYWGIVSLAIICMCLVVCRWFWEKLATIGRHLYTSEKQHWSCIFLTCSYLQDAEIHLSYFCFRILLRLCKFS